MLKNIVFTFVIVFGFLFTNKTFANVVDVTLVDIAVIEDSEQGVVNVFLYSYEESVPGVDMKVVFSDNVVIQDVFRGAYCDIAFNSSVLNNDLSLECFNDLDISMDGLLASFTYATDSEDYFFYVDESFIDFGGLELGAVENINKPANIQTDDVLQDYKNEPADRAEDSVVDFLRDNSMYVLGGVVVLVVILLSVFVLRKDRK